MKSISTYFDTYVICRIISLCVFCNYFLMSTQQSPIALYDERCVSQEFPPLFFSNYDKKYNMAMVNRGNTVQISLAPSEKGKDQPKVSGGRLNGNFIFHNINFRWESEHTINGERYPLEAHLVHFNEKYDDIGDCFGKKDGIAIFGVMFRIDLCICHGSRSVFGDLIGFVEQIAEKIDEPVMLPSPISVNQFLPTDVSKYYSYDGSLTIPGFMENVTWTVFSSSKTILKNEYERFTKIYGFEDDLLESNYRSIQDLNNRPVYLKK